MNPTSRDCELAINKSNGALDFTSWANEPRENLKTLENTKLEAD